jgi:hypothetical protein
MKLQQTTMSLLGSLFICTVLFAGFINAAESAAGSSILGIRNYMQNADKYSGTVEVEGVVSQSISIKHLVVLIDMDEYKECKVVTCSLLRLPVFWKGELPAVYDVVRVKGELGKRDGKRLFIVKELKKVGKVNAKE